MVKKKKKKERIKKKEEQSKNPNNPLKPRHAAVTKLEGVPQKHNTGSVKESGI